MVNASQVHYLIDPVTEFVGHLDASHEFVAILRPASLQREVWSAASFVGRNVDATSVLCSDTAELDKAFAAAQKNTTAFDFWMMLFDPEIRDETKTRAATELEELFSEASVYEHVQDIVYSAPLPSRACVQFVTQQSIGGRVREFATELLAAQDRVRSLFAVWAGMKSDPLVEAIGHRELTGRLISASFFRMVATKGGTQADLDRIGGGLALGLEKVCNPRILRKVLSSLKRSLPRGEYKQKLQAVDQERHLTDVAPVRVIARRSQESKYGLLQKAEKEVITIADLYSDAKDVRADAFLEELISRQATSKSEFVVKSLCNIASRTSHSGRRDVSFRLLKRALEQDGGLDAVLYMQIGNEFRSIREFDKALECYDEAKNLDDGSKAEGIRNEIIRVAVDQGKYDIALNQYLEIHDIHTQPSTLCSLGRLYRKVGDLRKARECYWSALSYCEGKNDTAEVGLAEATKQSGRIHRAIQRYQAVFNTYGSDLEPASVRVYTLALSQLLKLTKQFSSAERRLLALLEVSPHDHDVNFQLAKIYLLGGKTRQAEECLKLGNVPDLRGVAADLFRYAMSRRSGNLMVGSVDSESISASAYLPEDRGLASCGNALESICNKRYPQALASLDNASYVDRIHKDFGSVLRFHAHRAMNSAYDYRRDQAICRILKRGFKPLRQAARAIAEDSWDAASELEVDFCICVA